jgi:hypothetical protein
MNVPLLKETSIRIDMGMSKVKQNVDKTLDKLTDKTEEVVAKTEEMVERVQRGFVGTFGKQGALRNRIRLSAVEIRQQLSQFVHGSAC